MSSRVRHAVGTAYGAPSWAPVLDFTLGNVKLLNRTQRRVLLRKICAYRTVSEAATNVLAGIPSADLLAREREVDYRRMRSITNVATGAKPAYPTVAQWQRRWDVSDTGQWTRALIPHISRWTARKHGELNYHLTQFCSGHGCFGNANDTRLERQMVT